MHRYGGDAIEGQRPLAGTVGLEPTTERLTAVCSTIELRTHLKWFLENLNSVIDFAVFSLLTSYYDRLLENNTLVGHDSQTCSEVLRPHIISTRFYRFFNCVYACITSPGSWNIYDRLLKEEFATSYFPGLRRFKI